MIHTDIKTESRIIRILPEKMRPYAFLARLDRPIGAWLLLLPGLWAIVLAAGGLTALKPYDVKIILLFCLGAPVMRAAGCVTNDIWDRHLDREVARTERRPLAAGTMTVPHALAFLAALLLAGLVILLQMPLVTILLGILTIPLIALYPLMKRITWWPQAFLGLTFNFSALMGWSAITATVDLPALLLYLAGILWTLGYDTVYAHQDMEDDMRIGIKSSARRLGAKSKQAVSLFYGASWALTLLAAMLADGGIATYVLLIAAAGHLVRQMRSWDENDAASALQTFKSNRDYGLIVLLASAL